MGDETDKILENALLDPKSQDFAGRNWGKVIMFVGKTTKRFKMRKCGILTFYFISTESENLGLRTI